MAGFPPEEIASAAARIGIRDKHLFDRLRVLVWTGADDARVHPSNSAVLARQFAQLLGVDRKMETDEAGGILRERWRDAAGAVRVEACRVEGLGHAWSGGSLRGSHTQPEGPDASAAIVDFFLGTAERA